MAKTLDQIALAAARAALMEMDPGAEWKTGYGAKKKETLADLNIKDDIIDYWKQGKSLDEIEKIAGVEVIVPGGISELSPNILKGNFTVKATR